MTQQDPGDYNTTQADRAEAPENYSVDLAAPNAEETVEITQLEPVPVNVARNTIAFLQRVSLEGKEVPAFSECVNYMVDQLAAQGELPRQG